MSEWKHFSYAELKCRCGCEHMGMQDEFMRKVVVLRTMYGKPLTVSSAFRCSNHNCTVSSTGPNGPHTTGRAIDLLVSGRDAFNLLQLAMKSYAFTGIGISQCGNHSSRFIHLDDLAGPNRPWIWGY